MMNRTRQFLNKKRKGYAIAFEVMITLVLITLYIQVTLYSLVMLNAERYMNSVLTSTAIQTAKWGGTHTNAYLVNQVGGVSGNMGTTIQDNANALLAREGYDRMFGASILAGPKCIDENNDQITVTLRYKMPRFTVFSMRFVQGDQGYSQMGGDTMTYSIKMHSIMRPGKLLSAGGACQ